MAVRLPRKLFARLCLLLSLALAAQGVFAAGALCDSAGTPAAGWQERALAAPPAPCDQPHHCCTSGADCTQIHAQFIAAMPLAAVSPPASHVTFDPPPAPLVAGVPSLPLRPPIAHSA